VYSIQHYVIKFVSDLRQVVRFLWVLWFSPLEMPGQFQSCWSIRAQKDRNFKPSFVKIWLVVPKIWPFQIPDFAQFFFQDGRQGKDHFQHFSMVNISKIVFFCCIIFCFLGEQAYVYKKNYRTVWNWAKLKILRPVKILENSFSVDRNDHKGHVHVTFPYYSNIKLFR